MIENAYLLLNEKYKKCYEVVKNDDYYANFSHEKIIHSMQVFGVGKHIYKHEFQSKSEDYKERALTAVLLHDVGRFKEIKKLYESGDKNKLDHGIAGYEILRKIPQFSDLRITLPVKHHGHMIEELYKDNEYVNIQDIEIKKELQEIIFLVRDADKMANLFFFLRGKTLEDTMFFKLNFENKTSENLNKGISDIVLDEFFSEKPIQNKNVVSAADEVIRFLAWLYDVNFITSYKYFEKHNLLEKYIKFLSYCSQDEKMHISIEKKIKNYINNKYEQLKG